MDRRVTLLHGFLGAPQDWDDVRVHLSATATRAPQIPLAADWNAAIRQIADEIPSGSLLVGYSMGARIALAIAIQRQVELSGLVLISGQPGLPPSERALRWQHDQRIAERMERETPHEFLSWWYTQSVFAGDSADLKRKLVAEKSSLVLRTEAARLRTYSVAQQPDYAPRLSQLRIPVMFLAGEADAKYVKLAKQLASASPGAGCRIVEDCGHIVHRQQPQTVAQQVLGLERPS